jgi:hypothetical protein
MTAFLQSRTLLALVALLVASGALQASAQGGFSRSLEVADDEQVAFFPGVARLDRNGKTWLVPVHGRIFEPEHDDLLRDAATKTLIEALDIDDDAAESAVFVERVRPFIADNERGKKLTLYVGKSQHVLPPSAEDGQFQTVLGLPTALVTANSAQGEVGFFIRAADDRVFGGRALLLEEEGLSVISDIDDTVKISHVTDKAKLLRATFLEPFEAVPGMAKVYRRWAKTGARFHFVSSSPWQLYEPLATFFAAEGFPSASFHLKRVRLKDTTILNMIADPVDTKLAAIEPLFRGWPMRRFVLVGDTGERDPEVYGEVARRYPGQVQRIFLRNVTGERPTDERYKNAFRGVPAGVWSLFRKAEEIGL